MKRHTDGNTRNKNFVFIKDEVIQSSLPLDIEYNHDRCAYELGFIANQLLEMAQRFYDETRELKEENARLAKRAKRPVLKPSVIAKTDKTYQQIKKKRTQRSNPDKSKLAVSQTFTIKPKLNLKGKKREKTGTGTTTPPAPALMP